MSIVCPVRWNCWKCVEIWQTGKSRKYCYDHIYWHRWNLIKSTSCHEHTWTSTSLTSHDLKRTCTSPCWSTWHPFPRPADLFLWRLSSGELTIIFLGDLPSLRTDAKMETKLSDMGKNNWKLCLSAEKSCYEALHLNNFAQDHCYFLHIFVLKEQCFCYQVPPKLCWLTNVFTQKRGVRVGSQSVRPSVWISSTTNKLITCGIQISHKFREPPEW